LIVTMGLVSGRLTVPALAQVSTAPWWAWVGFKQHTAGWGRIAGAALMFAGLGLITKF